MAMPGVNLHLVPASIAPGTLGEPDTSACAESGLEQVIGDLLVQEEEQEEQVWKKRLEVELRSAVCEVHCDLQVFGKRVDARLQEAVAQVAPLAAALAQLQEENLRLRSQQEVLLRKVEALCQAVGTKDLQLPHGPVKENLTSDPQDSQQTSVAPLSRPQVAAAPPGRPNDPQAPPDLDVSFTVGEEPSLLLQDLDLREPLTEELVPDYPPSRPQDDAEDPLGHPKNAEAPPALDMSFTVGGELSLCLQDSEPQPQPPLSVDGMVPHPPTFATHRSLSAPSLMANIPGDDNMVLAAPS